MIEYTENLEMEKTIKQEFENWFYEDYGTYSVRSEWCIGDILVKDEKDRQKYFIQWLNAAFYAGYEAALKNKEKND